MQNQYRQRPASQNSMETPKFNYQSPSFNNAISPSNSFGYNPNLMQNNQNMIASFNINKSIAQSQSSFSLQSQLDPSTQKPQFMSQTPNFNIATNSPSSTGNSPILTKSIINPI